MPLTRSKSLPTTDNDGGSDRKNLASGRSVAGILYKWTNYGKGWRSRWFLLRDGILSYSKIRRLENVNSLSPSDDVRLIGDISTDRLSKMYSCSGRGRRKQHKTIGIEHSLREVSGEKITSSMCLCLDWNPSSTSIVVGLSDGSASVVSFTDSNLETIQEWKGHDFEVWTASFDLNNPSLVYTGSDDCKFSCWDIRDSPADNRVFQNSKVHTMGVCCISPSPSEPYSIFTGSYDETLRVWDTRSVSRPVNEISVGLGGGVWRIKHHPCRTGVVLAACMHNGFVVAKVSGGKGEVTERYNKHESLAYGADWYRGKDQRRSLVARSMISFFGCGCQKLCLSSEVVGFFFESKNLLASGIFFIVFVSETLKCDFSDGVE